MEVILGGGGSGTAVATCLSTWVWLRRAETQKDVCLMGKIGGSTGVGNCPIVGILDITF